MYMVIYTPELCSPASESWRAPYEFPADIIELGGCLDSVIVEGAYDVNKIVHAKKFRLFPSSRSLLLPLVAGVRSSIPDQ